MTLAAGTSHAQVECMGFRPAVLMSCAEGDVTNTVEGFKELECGAGRDGILNGQIPIFSLDGPIWKNSESNAESTFFDSEGASATLKNCAILEED